MAYASSLRREYRGGRWPLPPQSEDRVLDYMAKTRPVGWSMAEGQAALEALRTVPPVNGDLRAAIAKLEDWLSRYKPNELECLQCGYHWLSKLPRGKIPKRCQMCGGYAEVEGETMIVPVKDPA